MLKKVILKNMKIVLIVVILLKELEIGILLVINMYK